MRKDLISTQEAAVHRNTTYNLKRRSEWHKVKEGKGVRPQQDS